MGTKAVVVRNPKSLAKAQEDAVNQVCRDNGDLVSVTAVWQPRLFSEEGDDAIVYVTTKR